jgi:hypothetical protein
MMESDQSLEVVQKREKQGKGNGSHILGKNLKSKLSS